MKQIFYLINSLLCITWLCVGCTSDEAPEILEKEIVEVPVELNFTSSGRDLMTRANPEASDSCANKRPIFVDRVNVYTYRRPSDQKYNTKEEGFLQSGVLTLAAKLTGPGGKNGQPRYTAKGKIPLESGFQYRMTAVAYSKKQKEDSLFVMNQSYFDYAEIALKDTVEYKTPELFFGNVYAFDNETLLFQYEDVKDKQSALSGWLYRGVAGIELRLSKVDNKVKQIDLLADSINTQVKARFYDDFHSTYGKKRDGSFKHFLLGSWRRDVDKKPNDSIYVTNMNLLEVCTSLSLRIRMDGDEEEKEKLVVCRLKVRENKNKENIGKEENGGNEGDLLRSIPGDGGNGTGIIPGGEQTPTNPENPDSGDKNPFQICFKRNHYYLLQGDYSQLTTMEYVLQVTVNPNWDGDVYLPLDKRN